MQRLLWKGKRMEKSEKAVDNLHSIAMPTTVSVYWVDGPTPQAMMPVVASITRLGWKPNAFKVGDVVEHRLYVEVTHFYEASDDAMLLREEMSHRGVVATVCVDGESLEHFAAELEMYAIEFRKVAQDGAGVLHRWRKLLRWEPFRDLKRALLHAATSGPDTLQQQCAEVIRRDYFHLAFSDKLWECRRRNRQMRRMF